MKTVTNMENPSTPDALQAKPFSSQVLGKAGFKKVELGLYMAARTSLGT